jgi:hypothetical protein
MYLNETDFRCDGAQPAEGQKTKSDSSLGDDGRLVQMQISRVDIKGCHQSF